MFPPHQRRTVQASDLFQLKFIRGAELSPDGRHVVYAVSWVDSATEEEYIQLWLATLEHDEVLPLTHGRWKDMSPRWSPDGKLIAFISTRSDKPQVYLMPAQGGEARMLTTMIQGVGGGLNWAHSGKYLAFAARPSREPRDPTKPYRIDRHIYRFDGLGYLDDAAQDIYVISVDGGEPVRLTDDGWMHTAPQWSPDDREILYHAALPPNRYDQRSLFPGLWVVNVETRQNREIIGVWGRALAATWLPNSTQIAFVGAPHTPGFPLSLKNDLWIVNAQDGAGVEPECRTEGLLSGVGSYLQPDMPVSSLMATTIHPTNDGQSAYIHCQRGGALHIYRISLTGAELHEPVLAGDRACIMLDLSPDNGVLLYAVSTLNEPVDLFISEKGGGIERHLTNLNEGLLNQLQNPTVEHLQFSSPDGVAQEGWFMRPPIGDAPYPTILYIHGGPYGAFGHIYSFDFQILAGAGYGVLFTNFRGSGGYGSDFASAITGDWGRVGYTDQMAAVDHAIAQGLADPDRLGVCGLSYGGSATCWIVGHTDRFKAAVSENASTNWFGKYGVSDVAIWYTVEEFGFQPWENPSVYLQRSPISYAHNCRTPMLMIVGEMDLRCPASESEQFYAVLKANDCTAEMLRLPGSSHLGSIEGAPIIRRAQNEALLGWFKRHNPITLLEEGQ